MINFKSDLSFVGEFLSVLLVTIGMMIFSAMKYEISDSLVLYRVAAVIIFAALYVFSFIVCSDLVKKSSDTSSLPESLDQEPLPLEQSLYALGEISMTVSLFMFFGIEYFQFSLWWRFVAAIPICVSISTSLNLKKACLKEKPSESGPSIDISAESGTESLGRPEPRNNSPSPPPSLHLRSRSIPRQVIN